MKGTGFTLIELLVVVAILGILGTIVITSVTSVRQKTRDMKRFKDMETIQGAVEQYFRDNGRYPISNCSTNGGTAYTAYHGSWSTRVICPVVGAVGTNSLATELAVYIPIPLTDPSGTIPITSDRGYLYRSNDGANYCIMIWRTPENMNNFNSKYRDDSRCGGVSASGSCNTPNGNNIYISNSIYMSSSGGPGC